MQADTDRQTNTRNNRNAIDQIACPQTKFSGQVIHDKVINTKQTAKIDITSYNEWIYQQGRYAKNIHTFCLRKR